MSENSKSEKETIKSQLDKFREAARELGTDDDPERFAETVKRLAKAAPAPMQPKPERPAKAGRGGNKP